uniref:Protein kinase domain-containing protein n=1 Tax=Fagus sylvatica TaxID=28930 RepID=A0A2N9FEA3_FAGSY
MEKFYLCPLFLLQFLSLLLLSSAYTPPDKYFVNCGSNSNINVSGRSFIGDSNSGSFLFSGEQSSTEFILTINESKFSIHFTPHDKSFAFVSALEVFLAPPNFTSYNFTHVSPIGEIDPFQSVASEVLHTIHRVNVGGPQTNDTLWRNWILDDEYLLSGGAAKPCVPYNGTLNYDVLGGTKYMAPDLVYKTCRELNLSYSKGSNITWRFDVMMFLLKRKRGKHVDLPVLHHGKGTFCRKGTTNAALVRNLNLKLKMPLLEIQGATHNFDPKLLVGEGGFGRVYEGTLESGMKVAVKRSDPKHGQGLPEFETEITVLSKIRHRHLVSLIGYCEEESEMILVYEFMEKGSLREHLYDPNENSSERSAKRSNLSWKQRLEICTGAAKGLHYLHTCLNGGIIHRDVKSTNILLDEHFVAKVADFGLSRSGPDDPDHFSVGIKGSFGYVDPEYFRCFQFTDKSDVYSFGVVLLEVLCARPAIIDSPKREEVNLAEWGLLWQKKGQLEKIIDPCLMGEIQPDSLRRFGETVEKCLKENGAERPTMLDVLWDLEYALQLQKTAVHGVPHEDSTTNAILELHLAPNLGLLSNCIPDGQDDEVPLRGDDGLNTTESEVFSQMRIDGAR